ncbi:FecCD family ABC transporter permease [Alkaliphilus crotonatoxidans]
MEKKHKGKILILLLVLPVVIILISTIVGAANITLQNIIKVIGSKLPVIRNYIDTSDISGAQQAIIWNIRLPRIFLAFLVGYGLSVVGAAMQGIMKNPMADPFIVGTSSGAALGAAIAIILKLNHSVLGMGMVSVFAFVGSLMATVIVYQMARIRGRVPVNTLLLAGIAIGQLFTALMSFLMVIFSKDVANIVYWTLGSFSSRGWNHVRMAAGPILLGSILIYVFSQDLNIMLLGEETAENTGVEVERVKVIILVLSALVTAFAVSVSGIIGFIGLIVPHIVRILIGPDHRVLLPVSGILGGSFLMLADTAARTLIAPTEIPVGIITALLGAPFFIHLLRKSKRQVI